MDEETKQADPRGRELLYGSPTRTSSEGRRDQAPTMEQLPVQAAMVRIDEAIDRLQNECIRLQDCFGPVLTPEYPPVTAPDTDVSARKSLSHVAENLEDFASRIHFACSRLEELRARSEV